MQAKPIKTRIFQAPKDDLFAVLQASLPPVQEKSIVALRFSTLFPGKRAVEKIE